MASKHLHDAPTNRKVRRVLCWELLDPFPSFSVFCRMNPLDPDLAGVRDPDALARLPYAERAAWQAL